jgi:hypothetical protein
MGIVASTLQDHGTPVAELAKAADGHVEIRTFRIT